MWRFLLVFLALLLVVDLADDGFLGKARFVSPVSPFSDSVAPDPQYNVELVDSWCGLSLPDSLGIFYHYQSQTVTCRFLDNLKRISFCQASSSGGLPL
jgi:hypothetical protein